MRNRNIGLKLFIISCTIAILRSSYIPYTLYSEYFGGLGTEYVRQILVNPDDNSMTVLGTGKGFGSSTYSINLMRLNYFGEIEFYYRFGEPDTRNTYCKTMLEIPDGFQNDGYILEGKYERIGGTGIHRSLLAKVNVTTGQIIWQMQVNRDGFEQCGVNFRDPRGNNTQEGEIVWVTSGKTSGINPSITLFRVFENNGTIISQFKFDNSDYDYCYSFRPCPSDGGYAIAGETKHFGGFRSILVIRLDKDLQVKWSKVYGRTDRHGIARSVKEVSDGGLIVCGEYRDANNDRRALVLRLDPDGNVIFFKRYFAGVALTNQVQDAIELPDGGFLIVGRYKGWFARLTSSGDLLWSKLLNYGGVSDQNMDAFYGVTSVSYDGGENENYVLTGKYEDKYLIIHLNSSLAACEDDYWDNTHNIVNQDEYPGYEIVDLATVFQSYSVGMDRDFYQIFNYTETPQDIPLTLECYSCGQYSYNSPDVCFNHGTCSSTPPFNCSCEFPYLSDTFCENEFECFGLFYNDTEKVCGAGQGVCIGFDTCSCFSGFFGRNCSRIGCFEYERNDTSNVCSGVGNCTRRNFCECKEGYFGERCNITKCEGTKIKRAATTET